MDDRLTEGLHLNIPMDQYIKDPCEQPSLSKGALFSLFYSSPAHVRYNHPRLNPDAPVDQSSRADLGSAIHAAILNDDRVVYGAFENYRKKVAQEWRDFTYESGKIPMLEKDRTVVTQAASAARDMLLALPGWSGDIQTEGTMIWKDGPAWKRGRFDMWNQSCNMLIDIKTTSSANPAGWIRRILAAGGYDIQAEHYLEGIRTVGDGDENTSLLFLLVEIEPPFCCSFVGLGPEYAEAARRKIKIATDRWNHCMETDEWPGYTQFPHWAELPAWQEMEIQEQDATDKTKQEIQASATGLL